MEVPLSFAMMKAWNNNALKPTQLRQVFDGFISTNFSFTLNEKDANECSELLFEYDQLMGLGKHECIEDDTFSVQNYGEADAVLQRWSDLLGRANRVHERASHTLKPAIYQLILHPIKATQIYIALRVALGKNKHFAQQRRTIANKYAQEVLRLFDADFDLSCEYHELLGGKWNHMMDQPHYGCRWDEDIAPFRDMVPGLCYVQTRQKASPMLGNIGVAVEGHPGYRPGLCCEEHDLMQPSRGERVPGMTTSPLEPLGAQSRWFEVYSHSTESVHWSVKVTSDAPWFKTSLTSGYLQPEDPAARIHVFVDWASVPDSFDDEVLIDVRSDLGDYEIIHVPVKKRKNPIGFTGFVESDRHISMNATNFDKSKTGDNPYSINPFLGRTGAGGIFLTTPPANPDNLEYLQYSFYNFTPKTEATLILYFTMTFNTDAKNPLKYDVVLDDTDLGGPFRLVPDAPAPGEMPPGDLPAGWMEENRTMVWTRRHTVEIATTGSHTVNVRMRNTNCILEKIVVDLGHVLPSYLGPPESALL